MKMIGRMPSRRSIVIASFAGVTQESGVVQKPGRPPHGVGSERFQAKAKVTAGEERQRLFKIQADKLSIFHDYQKKTARQIPVVVLERIK
jgi:hypothetical protein